MASFTLRTTAQGLQLLASTLNGQKVNFTHVVLGSGRSGSGADMEELTAPVLSLPITVLRRVKNKVTLTAVLQYGDIETGFTWSEVGIYATDPGGGEDILVYYSSTDKPDYIPGMNETTLNNKMLQFTIAVLNADNITITVEGNTIYATSQQLETLRSEVAETFEQISEGGGEYGNTVVTLTHTKSGTVHDFAGLGSRNGLVPCQFKSTGGYTEGDTATIDGTAYTITLTGADAPETDLFVADKSILVDVDTEGKTINFKAGGGLTKAKLALATATEDTVFSGKTFYGGDSKTLRTGRALSETTTATAAKILQGYTAYNNQGVKMTGTALNKATTAGAGDILSGKTAYNNLGQLITGTMSRVVQAGTVYPVAEQSYTVRYENNLGAPKLVIAWFSLNSINSYSPYVFQGAVTGNHAGTSIAGRSGSFRNQNQSMANSTYTIGSSYFSFTVDKYDYMGGGSYECSYIFVW